MRLKASYPLRPVAAFLLLAFLVCPGQACLAGEETEVPLNFDTQIVKIFEIAQTASEVSAQHAAGGEDRGVLARILDKFRKHKMMLKNAVYRTDMGVIRITWADDGNEDIVKAAYKTSKDAVLGNSVYADKRQVVDVKIMYRKDADTYDYLRLQNMDNLRASYDAPDKTPAPPPEKPAFHYLVESKLTNEQCRFCHILAQNDGSPKGVFFPRYQEDYKTHDIKNINALFHADHFKLTPAGESRALGLPQMGEDFLYQKVSAMPDAPPENTRFTRMMIELPQLVEVMARDNKQSMCVVVDFGTAADMQATNNYVCADNSAQRLLVKLTNPVLTSNKGPKEYSEVYFEEK
jgi:hypothetical protein